MQEYMFKSAKAYQINHRECGVVLSHKSIVVSLVLPENLTYSAKTLVSRYGMYYILVYL